VFSRLSRLAPKGQLLQLPNPFFLLFLIFCAHSSRFLEPAKLAMAVPDQRFQQFSGRHPGSRLQPEEPQESDLHQPSALMRSAAAQASTQ